MPYKIIISERAERNLDGILRYLENEWSIRIRNRFLDILENKIDQISLMPKMYEMSRKKMSIRRCVVTKHTILYYKINRKTIEIITIQDSRQNRIG